MNPVELSADGRLTQDGKMIDSRPLPVLGAPVRLAEGCTLRSCFRLVANHPILAELNPFFPTCMEQVAGCPETGCRDPEIVETLVTKTVEMIGFPGKPRLEIYHSLVAVGNEDIREIRLCPLESILDMPLRLGKLKHIVFGDRVDVFEFETVFTLFELLDTIAWELSFHGSPPACRLRR